MAQRKNIFPGRASDTWVEKLDGLMMAEYLIVSPCGA